MPYKAVLFDAFGTIVQIKARTHPYRHLLREGMRGGRQPKSDDIHRLMTLNLGLPEAAEHLGIPVSLTRLDEINQMLVEELNSIAPFPDAGEAMAVLRRHNIAIGVVSNLAQPYGSAVKRLFPDLDAYIFSYEQSVLKPDPAIYRTACRALGVAPGHMFDGDRVAMVGDSLRCDRDGPRVVGITGVHLARSGARSTTNLLDFARDIVAYE
jgi:HAD superfamily hydrolase (TIGR01549 family)